MAEENKPMAQFRRNKTWWTDFSVNRQPFQQPLDTTDWREVDKREKAPICRVKAARGKP
jgi:hypothetical protein